MMMEKLPVYILAGGRSSRFGSDKARALLGGEPLIARLARQIAPVASRITAVADVADKYADLGLRTIADRRPGLGPLGGIETALLDALDSPEGNPEWLIIFSCDLTVVCPAWIELLAAGRPNESLAAAFIEANGRRHPFPGLYHPGLLPTVQRHLDARRLAVRDLIDAVTHVDIAAPADWPVVAQVNTRDDLNRAET